MQALSQEVEDLLVPEPRGGPEVDLASAGLEEDQMTAVLQGRHIAVERLPVIGDDGHATGGRELLGDLIAEQGWGIRMPTDPFAGLALG